MFKTFAVVSLLQKAGLYSAVRLGGMIVRQAFNHDKDECKHILRNVLGEDWETKWNQDNKQAIEMQAKLEDHIKDEVMNTGSLPKFKDNTHLTLVYAHGLHPERFIVDLVMQRLLREDEEPVAPQSTKSKDGVGTKLRTEVLAELFGLMESSQRTTKLVDLVLREGVVNKIKDDVRKLMRAGFVRLLVRSALTREYLAQSKGAQDKVFFDVAPEMVSEEDVQAFSANGDKLGDAEEFAANLYVKFFD